MSEGLKAVAKPESDEFIHADDDEIIDTSDQLGEDFDQDVITTMTRDIANLAEAIDEVINDLESDEWKPGSLVVSTIMEKSNRRLMHFYDAFCKLLRLHYIQSDDLYDGDDNKYDMFLEMIVFIRKTIEIRGLTPTTVEPRGVPAQGTRTPRKADADTREGRTP